METLRAALTEALQRDNVPYGEDVLRTARLDSSGNSWAKLRAVLAACFSAAEGDRLLDGPDHRTGSRAKLLAEHKDTEKNGERWAAKGRNQLSSLAVTGPHEEATFLNHAARWLHKHRDLLETRPALRQALLTDAATL